MAVTFLAKILESKRVEVDSLESVDQFKYRIEHSPKRVPIKPTWTDKLDVVAEIKRKSPSKGELASIEYPDRLAKSFADAGASIISVLPDQQYFGAKSTDFEVVRKAVSIPILRKDFIVDEKQIYESYLMGADLILLIVAAFKNLDEIAYLFDCAVSLGLSVLVETHTQKEIEMANRIHADIIGVNVRDLSTFDEKPEIGEELIRQVSPTATPVWESSITTLDQAIRAQQAAG